MAPPEFIELAISSAFSVVIMTMAVFVFFMAVAAALSVEPGGAKTMAGAIAMAALIYLLIGTLVHLAKIPLPERGPTEHQDNHQPYIPQAYSHPLELENYKLIQRLEKSDIAKRMCWAELQESQK